MHFHDDLARVREAQRAVPRAFFLPPSLQARAEEDGPLPIGFDQTTSQPSLIALMIAQLALEPAGRVLEVGTGSGYQTAILARLAGEIFSVERIPELAAAAEPRLAALGCRNVALRTGDGARGWPEAAPFDAIIVAAAAAVIPPALPAQLKPGGRLVIPVGIPGEAQTLVLVEKTADGELRHRALCGVRFVPLVSGPA
ncbi:MAG TPA: protein-L-isoaspartate(D-aspartate) O-methyltransferase [Opitutaceae bacterium]|nr:protein-L-isoaspartate(D-aspartate) O-methyltransferase [Opitutaceae bacterium]